MDNFSGTSQWPWFTNKFRRGMNKEMLPGRPRLKEKSFAVNYWAEVSWLCQRCLASVLDMASKGILLCIKNSHFHFWFTVNTCRDFQTSLYRARGTLQKLQLLVWHGIQVNCPFLLHRLQSFACWHDIILKDTCWQPACVKQKCNSAQC